MRKMILNQNDRKWYNTPIRDYLLVVVFPLFYLNALSFSLNSKLSMISYLSFVLCALIMGLLFIKGSFNNTEINILMCFLLIMLLKVCAAVIVSQWIVAIKVIMRIIIVLTIVLIIPNYFNKNTFRLILIFNCFMFVFIILGFVDYYLSKDKVFFLLFGSMNTFAAVFMVLFIVNLMMINIDKRLLYVLNCILAMVLIVLSKSRTPLLAILIIAFVYFVMKIFFSNKTKKRRILNSISFDILLVLAIIAIGLYVNIDELPAYNKINQISLSLFGKNIDSGRPEIWKNIMDNLSGHILFGYGDIREALFDNDYSAHSQYFQLLGDNGVVGLILLLFVFRLLWNEMIEYKYFPCVRVYLAVLIGIMVYNCFEVTLIENKFALGCFEWLAIAIGRYFVLQITKKQRLQI